MAKRTNLMDYVDYFIKEGEIRTESNFNGDYKRNNKAYMQMKKIFEMAKESSESEKFYLTILQKTRDATALITCCSQMLELTILPEIARKKLVEIIRSKNYSSILSFEAEMLLQEWDNGNIKPIHKD